MAVGTLQAQQETLLADLYGRGVHAYFDGNLESAHKLLSEAIDQKIRDPRCYYFRGVVLTYMGRPEQAAKDFHEGATLEAKDVQKVYPVNRSLQRVQGKVRLTLETHRKEARLALRKYEEARRRVRYEALKAAEKDVLRSVDRPATNDAPKLPDDAKVDPNDPFSNDEAGTLGGGAAAPSKQIPGTKPAIATTRRRPEPAAGTVTTTTPGQPAAKPAAGANPFGGAPAAKPAAGANPFGDAPAAKPAAGANPFGDAPAAKPAANPFGAAPAEEPAAKPATNPFGNGGEEDGKPAAADGAKKSGGAFGALLRAGSKSLPGSGLFRAVNKSLPIGGAPVDNPEAGSEEESEEEIELPGEANPVKPAANPFGPPAAGAKPIPAKPAANPFGAP